MKNSVYVLPDTAEAREDFGWIAGEIRKDGGEATLCQAVLLDGATDESIQTGFIDAREKDYRDLAEEIRTAGDGGESTGAAVAKLRKRFDEIVAVDFFHAPGRQAVDGLLRGLEARVAANSGERPMSDARRRSAADVAGKTWVTRKGIRIDRIASAWLIRRFLDENAAFRFVPVQGYVPSAGELRFDMFEAEFTHDGDLCTFEVLVRDFGIDDAGVRAIAEIVHDIDLKEARYGRAETSGVAHMIDGIARTTDDDEARLASGSVLFDSLHAFLSGEAR